MCVCVCVCVCACVCVHDETLDEVDSFAYLGSNIDKTGKASSEVGIRIEKAGKVYQMWQRKVFRSNHLSKTTKMRVFQSLVMSVLLYAAETWTITQKDVCKLKIFHMKCIRDIL